MFYFKSACFIYFITLDAQSKISKSDNFAKSFKTDNGVRNERFEELISEILIGEAPLNDFMIHYDSTSYEFIDGIINKTNAKKEMKTKPKDVIITVNASHPATTVMLNYDKKDNLMTYNISRRFTIHVISLKKPLEFDDLYLIHLKPSDVIMFICQKHYATCEDAFDNGSKINVLDPYFLNQTKFLNKVLLTVIIEVLDYQVRLYEICFYCGTTAGVLNKKHEIDLTIGMSYDDIDLYSKLIEIFKFSSWNFNSHIFKVGFPYQEINFGCRNPKETGTTKQDEYIVSCDAIYSLEGKMLREVQKRLNFKVELVTFRSTVEGGVVEKLIDVTNEHRADWAVGSISVTASRTEKVSFSFPVSEDPIKVIYSTEQTFLKDGLRIVHVFSTYIWILIAFTLLVQSVVVYISNRIAGQNKKKFSNVVWAVGFMLTEQPLQIYWKSLGGRVLVSWVLCCICISTLLKAQLTSYITKPPVHPLAKFDELVSGGFQLNLISAQTRFISELLNSSSDDSFKEISHRVNSRLDMCSTFKDMIGKNEMLIDELDVMYDELNARCGQYLTSEDLMSLRMTCDNVFPSTHAWAFPKKAPYINFISNQIMWYHQHGLQKKWSETLRFPPGNNSVYFDGVSLVDRSRLRPKKIKGFGLFILWYFGIGLSVLCFITEIVLNELRLMREKKGKKKKAREEVVGKKLRKDGPGHII